MDDNMDIDMDIDLGLDPDILTLEAEAMLAVRTSGVESRARNNRLIRE